MHPRLIRSNLHLHKLPSLMTSMSYAISIRKRLRQITRCTFYPVTQRQGKGGTHRHTHTHTHTQCCRRTQLEPFLHSSDTTALNTHSLATELLILRKSILTVISPRGGLEERASELQCDLQLLGTVI